MGRSALLLSRSRRNSRSPSTRSRVKTFVDSFRTPHTEKLHVVERFKLVDDGKVLQVNIVFDDPDAFNAPWSVMQRYDRVQRSMEEEVCAENNTQFFAIPVANKPDF